MKSFLKSLLALMVAAVLVAPAYAADNATKAEKKAKKAAAAKGGKKAAKKAHAVFNLPETIELTADQKSKLEAVKTEYTPKIDEAQKAVAGVLTADQKKARAAAQKEARASGKKGKALQEAVDAAAPLSDDVKAKQKTAQEAHAAVLKEARGKVEDLLTADQKEKLPKAKGKGKAKGKAKAKKTK